MLWSCSIRYAEPSDCGPITSVSIPKEGPQGTPGKHNRQKNTGSTMKINSFDNGNRIPTSKYIGCIWKCNHIRGYVAAYLT